MLTGLGLALLTAGCDTTQQASKAPQTRQISCKIPNITSMDGTTNSQSKGGLEITIVPATYKTVRADKHTITETEPNFGEQMLAPSSAKRATMTFVQEETIPQLKALPSRLQFAVRVNNKLSRVFRGQGSVVQINVAGKLLPINRENYAEFMDGIVPPRNEAEFKIYGPSLDSIPEKGTIGIFIYDVVTATDSAGNVTEKQNYEWVFNYDSQLIQDTGEVSVKRGWVDTSTMIMRKYQNQQAK